MAWYGAICTNPDWHYYSNLPGGFDSSAMQMVVHKSKYLSTDLKSLLQIAKSYLPASWGKLLKI